MAIYDDILEFEYTYKDVLRIAYITWKYQDHTTPNMKLTRAQFPVNLKYWLTMHKWQGQTLDGVVIDCENIFASGLFYSTLARCNNSDNIHIKRLIPSEHYIYDQEVVDLINLKELEYTDMFEYEFNSLPKIEKKIFVYFKRN